MPPPQVSIIIPTYAAKPSQLSGLQAALESALKQTFSDREIWVVDDQTPPQNGENSIEKLVSELSGPQVHYLRTEKHFGAPAGPRNLAIRRASGKWIAFLDHDDAWHPEKLSRQMALGEANPNWVMIHTNATFQLPEDSPPHNRLFFPNLKEDLLHTYPICEGISSVAAFLNGFTIFSTVCIRKSFLEKVGFLDEETSPCDDTDLFLKLGETKAEVGFIREALAIYRIGAQSLSADRLLINQKKIRVFEKALERSPAAGKTLLQRALRHTTGVYAFQAFQAGQYGAALAAFDHLAGQKGMGAKAKIYRMILRYGHPRMIHLGRKILAVFRRN